jgi:enterochelin esterase family protein
MRNQILFVVTILLAVAAAVVDAQSPSPAYLQVRSIPHGIIQSVAYTSKSLGTDRKMIVYTPPNYEKSTDKYPVLYLLHGANSDETSWTTQGKAHVILDNLLADGKIKPMVVVMPFGYAFARPAGAGRGDAAENKQQREGFTRDFLEDVMPKAESSFRLYADRDHRAIAGLSLGGAQALAIGLTHTELFSRIAGFSPALGASNNPETGGVNFDTVLADPVAINSKVKVLWVSVGTEDTLYQSIVDYSALLSKHKIEHAFHVTGGAHTYAVWQRNLNEAAPLFFID